jgi:hypothetical protein
VSISRPRTQKRCKANVGGMVTLKQYTAFFSLFPGRDCLLAIYLFPGPATRKIIPAFGLCSLPRLTNEPPDSTPFYFGTTLVVPHFLYSVGGCHNYTFIFAVHLIKLMRRVTQTPCKVMALY